MFDRFVRLAQARRALQEERFEEALRLAEDPLVREHRKADDIRRRVCQALVRRAERRAAAGELSAATLDVDRALAAVPDDASARSARELLSQQIEDRASRDRARDENLDQARRAVEGGDLSRADGLLEAARDAGGDDRPIERVAATLTARRERSASRVEDVRSRLDSDPLGARRAFLEARALNAGIAGADRLAVRVAQAVAGPVVEELPDRLARGGLRAAVDHVRELSGGLPELWSTKPVQRALSAAGRDVRRAFEASLDRGEIEDAIALIPSLEDQAATCCGLTDVVSVLDDLRRGLTQERNGNFAASAHLVGTVARRLGHAGLKKRVRQLERDGERADKLLAAARDHASHGRLNEARGILVEMLEDWPMHEAARREMEVLDRGTRDVEQRMDAARRLVQEGRLSEASAQLVTLAVDGAQGDEARLLIRDVQNRIQLVDKGIEQILRSLHGRGSSSRRTLEHCTGRVEELRKLQSDHAELERIGLGLEAEVAGLAAIDAGTGALERDEPVGVRAAAEQLADGRERLLEPGRLDARVLEFGDRLLASVEAATASGRVLRAREWLSGLESLALPDLDARIDDARTRLDTRDRQAEEAAESGLERLAERDLAGAEDALERARACSVDAARVRKLAAAVESLRDRSGEIERVEVLASANDFDAARRQLGRMGPTPDLLRTRIFDLKQSLARSQGLDGAFVLRVDEGGEFVVQRGESTTIGNLRDGTADLSMLANLAGTHARITRTMSFHGGMQDRIVAERGEIAIRGRSVEDHVLKTGDRVRLGESVEFEYRVPSGRSLTACLTLRGGFQVGGTDKVLLMKDRGRDGRILIGPAKDAHVRLANVAEEIEIYASKDGQIRVRAPRGGEMDGRPFQGEHPVTAGALIRVGDVTLTLSPLAKP